MEPTESINLSMETTNTIINLSMETPALARWKENPNFYELLTP